MDGIIEALMTLCKFAGIDPKVVSVAILVLFIVSEILSLTTKVKANGVFQLIQGIVSAMAGKVMKKG